MVKRYHTSLPSSCCGFDSRCPLHRRTLLATALALAVAGCGASGIGPDAESFRRGAGLPAETVRGWTVTAIEVDVPQTLSVSEDPSVRYPATDIVWWEDPPGDRRAQVARVMEAAAREAVADLDGPEPVTMRLRVNRFHALTPVALASGRRGWHDVNFDVAIVARDGRVLAEERGVNADLRALQGAQAEAARQRGETQAARIRRRVAAVLRGWLGLA